MAQHSPSILTDAPGGRRAFGRHTASEMGTFAFLAAVVLIYFFWYAGPGLQNGFHPDDLMNLHFAVDGVSWPRLLAANLTPFSTLYRPAGALAYRVLYESVGLDPSPYRVACYALLVINTGLLFAWVRRLSGNNETALLAAVLFSFHRHLHDLYINTGTIYDLLCAAFYFTTLLWYARVRARGQVTWRSGGGLFLCATAAFNAKEVGVTLPAALLAYEVFCLRTLLRTVMRARPLIWLLAVTNAVGLYVKLGIADTFSGNAGYQVSLTVRQFFQSTRSYLNEMVLRSERPVFNTTVVVVFFVLLVTVAVVAKRGDIRFLVVFVLVAPLPVVFIPVRPMFAFHLTYSGYCALAAIAIVALREWLWVHLWKRAPVPAGLLQPERLGTLAFLLAGLAYAWAHDPVPYQLIDDAPERTAIWTAIRDVERVHPCPSRGGRLLYVRDPMPPDAWGMHYISRLVCRDPELQVFRSKTMNPPPDRSEWGSYDVVADYGDSGLRVVARR